MKSYEKLEISISLLENTDIIMTSSGFTSGGDLDNNKEDFGNDAGFGTPMSLDLLGK